MLYSETLQLGTRLGRTGAGYHVFSERITGRTRPSASTAKNIICCSWIHTLARCFLADLDGWTWTNFNVLPLKNVASPETATHARLATNTATAKSYICCPEGKPNFPNVKLFNDVTFTQLLWVRLTPTTADVNVRCSWIKVENTAPSCLPVWNWAASEATVILHFGKNVLQFLKKNWI